MAVTPGVPAAEELIGYPRTASPDLLRDGEDLRRGVDVSRGRRLVRGVLRAARPGAGELRNGYRRRGWDTRTGTVELAIPPLRRGSYFPGWLAFLRSLVARGLSGVSLVIPDHHRGLVNAIAAALPGASWQRCRTHYPRNLLTKVPKSAQLRRWRPWYAQSSPSPTPPWRPSSTTPWPRWRRSSRPSTWRTPARTCWPSPRLPARGLAADLVEQPPPTAEQPDPPPHRRRRHLPRPGSASSAWSAPCRPNRPTSGPKPAAP